MKSVSAVSKVTVGSFKHGRRITVVLPVVIVMLTLAAGYTVVRSSASGFFASTDPETGTIATNASVITDSTASGGKAIQFNAPPATPPPSDGGTGGGGTGGGTGGGGGGGGTPPPPAATCQGGSKPSASNTGVPAGTALTVVNGDLTVTAAGTVVDGKDVHGFIVIKASNVTVQNTIVRGRATSSNAQLVQVQSGTGIIIKNSEIANQYPSPLVDGISGDNFTASCVNIHGTVDGMKPGSNSRIEYSYIHDLDYELHDPNQSNGPTHNDTIQIYDTAGVTIVGNTLVPGPSQANSAIQITQDFGSTSNVTITGNWADGGQCTFNFSQHAFDNASPPALTVAVSGNRFGRNTIYANCPILIGTKTTITGSGNVWDDNGQAVPVQQHD